MGSQRPEAGRAGLHIGHRRSQEAWQKQAGHQGFRRPLNPCAGTDNGVEVTPDPGSPAWSSLAGSSDSARECSWVAPAPSPVPSSLRA